ncbi:MAG TPA: hypothetical protein VK518_15305, partial [Puia sp.]|nr:hypothetical protein [Puia sp.]
QSVFGYPAWSAAQSAVSLDCGNTGNGQYGITEYDVSYHFKQGYSYNIQLYTSCTLKDGTNASPWVGLAYGIKPYLNTVTDANCGLGPTFMPTKNVTYAQSAPSAGGFSWLTLQNTHPFDRDYDYVRIAALPSPTMSNYNTVYVRKVQIIESAPAATMTPATVVAHCGYPTNQTFTMNIQATVNNITGYTWNVPVGSPDVWMYNGAPAVFPITTSTNSLTLTANCTTSALPAITATAFRADGAYATATAGSSVSTSLPDGVTISGPDGICGVQATTQYSLSGGPSCPGSSVAWSFDAPDLDATISSQSGGQVVLQSGFGSGIGNLIATVANGCGSNTISKPISITGIALVGGTYYSSAGPGQTSPTQGLSWFVDNAVAAWSPGGAVDVHVNLSMPGTTSWDVSSTPGYPFIAPFSLGADGSFDFFLGGSGTTAFDITGNTPCGPVTNTFKFSISGFAGSNDFRVSPNPLTGDRMTIALDDDKATGNTRGMTGGRIIYAIKVTDLVGRVQKSVEYKAGIPRADILLTGIQRGNYFVSVYDGKKWNTKMVLMK